MNIRNFINKFKQWKTVVQTESKNYPIRHRYIVLGPFIVQNWLKFWAELISWNPRGHCTKMIGKAGKLEDDTPVHYAIVLYAGREFKEHIIKSAKLYTVEGKFKYYAGDMKLLMKVDEGEFFQHERGRWNKSELKKLTKETPSIQKSAEWSEPQRAIVDENDNMISYDDKMERITKFFGEYLE